MFLIATIGSHGTRWVADAITRAGVKCAHDQPARLYDAGIVGSPKWLDKLPDFHPVIHQLRDPRDYMRTQARSASPHPIRYPYAAGYVDTDGQFKYNTWELAKWTTDKLDPDLDPYTTGELGILLMWMRVHTWIDEQPQVDYWYRVEELRASEHSFYEMMERLGYDRSELKTIDNDYWDNSFTHNPSMGKPWERKIEHEPWPVVTGFPEMERLLDQVKERAAHYGYEV